MGKGEKERLGNAARVTPQGIHLQKLHNHSTFAELCRLFFMVGIYCGNRERDLQKVWGVHYLSSFLPFHYSFIMEHLPLHGSLHRVPVAPAVCWNYFQSFVQNSVREFRLSSGMDSNQRSECFTKNTVKVSPVKVQISKASIVSLLNKPNLYA